MAFDKQHFYAQFQSEHATFLEAIQGFLPDRERYTSQLLYRLMFIYFLQKGGFLAGHTDFLCATLQKLQMQSSIQGFFYFYRRLLLHLFCTRSISCTENLPDSTQHLDQILAELPPLNSSLFDPQELVHDYSHIHIPDAAFARLFTFFESYSWQLDQQHDNAITPDVLGYIFARHINQKHMGAYYTSEDVTNYISQYAIITYIFDTTRKKREDAFQADGLLWCLLRTYPDRYISTAIRCEERLPTETEREYQARHIYYAELKKKLMTGTITCIQDFITYNLDIQRFAHDAIHQGLAIQPDSQDVISLDLALLRTFYESISQVAILDPTCGSGAFLFTALNILAPLYTACLDLMEYVIASHDSDEASMDNTSDDTSHMAFFRTILGQVDKHPNRTYFILEAIVNNLYGVDIMPEAVEICKLLLFLKLATHFQGTTELAPLLALTFNIRYGNALVGFVHCDDAYQALDDDLQVLTAKLDHNLASQYGINQHEANYQEAFAHWRASHRPFHWCLEFHDIMARGGFDVIIGNPPYVEYSKARQTYQLRGYETEKCGNIYAAVIERSLTLSRPNQAHLGLIVPLSVCGGERFEQLRRTIINNTSYLWLANFEIFPSRLFDGAFQRLSILFAQHNAVQHYATHTTRIQRWYAVERPYLINRINYTTTYYSPKSYVFPKLASRLQENLLHKLQLQAGGYNIAHALQPHKTAHFVYYQEATNYWMKATCHIPFYKKNGVVMEPNHGRFLYFNEERTARTIMALLNSSLFYVWFSTYSDGFHLSHTLVKEFPVNQALYAITALPLLAVRLEQDIKAHAKMSTRNTRPNATQSTEGHQIALEEYRMHRSKPLLDEIDRVLSQHYNFTDAELDFIINYDIKYRMGRGYEEEAQPSQKAHLLNPLPVSESAE